MSGIADAPVAIRPSPQLVPSTPPWFGEATLIVHYLIHLGVLSSIESLSFFRGAGHTKRLILQTLRFPKIG